MPPGSGSVGASQAGQASVPLATWLERRVRWRSGRSTGSGLTGPPSSISRWNGTPRV
jgi:hypothetical protein